jgi:hypothetical protein
MRSFQFVAAILPILALFLPASHAQDAKGDAGKLPPKEKLATKDKMLSAGKVTGRLTQIDPAQRSFMVQAEYAKPNPGAIQNIANLAQQLASARQRGDAKGIINAQVELAKAKPYDVATTPLEFEADDVVKIRTLLTPLEYDAKGKPRKLTAEEIKERKGKERKLPGYEADFDSLRPGQYVEINIKKPTSIAKKKSRDENDADGAQKQRYKALMVVIVEDAQK